VEPVGAIVKRVVSQHVLVPVSPDAPQELVAQVVETMAERELRKFNKRGPRWRVEVGTIRQAYDDWLFISGLNGYTATLKFIPLV
jgi:hypothetical protein